MACKELHALVPVYDQLQSQNHATDHAENLVLFQSIMYHFYHQVYVLSVHSIWNIFPSLIFAS